MRSRHNTDWAQLSFYFEGQMLTETLRISDLLATNNLITRNNFAFAPTDITKSA